MKSFPAIDAGSIAKFARENRLLILAASISFFGVLVSCTSEPACLNALGKLGEFIPGQTLSVFQRNCLELYLWLIALTIGGIHFFLRRVRSESAVVLKADFYICLSLCALASVAYLFDPEHIPWQVTADECYFIELLRNMSTDLTVNPLSMCAWWHWPSGIFVLYCHASELLGSVSFGNLRFLSALAGLAICPLAYVYFRCTYAPALACAATMLVIFNNALMAYCRVAQQHASCVILELASLTLLFLAQRRQCPFFAYLGGVLAGLGFYVYYPARLTIFLWVAFVMAMIAFKHGQTTKQLARLLAITLLGFALTVLPMSVHILANSDAANKYTRDRIILIPEGMAMQRSHWQFKSDTDAYLSNISRGLIAFNSKEVDGWGLYENPYIGFCDPITGAFLWLGIIAVLAEAFRRTSKPIELFQLGSFLINYFILCFIANIAPSYARLFVALPFVAFLAVKGMGFLALLLAKLPFSTLRTKTFGSMLILGFAGAGTLINIWAFTSWVADGLRDGEDYGSTLRYIMSRSDQPGYSFYVLTSKDDLYIPWARYDDALQTMVASDQNLKVISSNNDSVEELKPLTTHRPFTAFMLKSRWDLIGGRFKKMFPNSVKHHITGLPYERVGLEVY